jgi:hypothetical protein
MSEKPKRIQRKRTKGWKMPKDTVYVGRGSDFGNPFKADDCRKAGYGGSDRQIANLCVEAFKVWLGPMWRDVWNSEVSERSRKLVLDGIPSLRGKNLACWCPVINQSGDYSPCHADVLLEIANQEYAEGPHPQPPTKTGE